MSNVYLVNLAIYVVVLSTNARNIFGDVNFASKFFVAEKIAKNIFGDEKFASKIFVAKILLAKLSSPKILLAIFSVTKI